MPPKRKATTGGGPSAKKKKAVAKSNSQDVPEDETKHSTVRVLVPSMNIPGVENMKERTGITEMVKQDDLKTSPERVVVITGKVGSIVDAIGIISRPNARLLVPEVLVYASLAEFQNKLKDVNASNGNVVRLSSTSLPNSNDRTISVKDMASNRQAIVDVINYLTEFESEHMEQVQKHVPLIPYVPKSIRGVYGDTEKFQRQAVNQPLASINPFTNPDLIDDANAQPAVQPQQPQQYQQQQPHQTPIHQANRDAVRLGSQDGVKAAAHYCQTAPKNQQLLLNITVPKDCVGAIIGKSGAKINEIRQQSGATVKIDEAASANDRYDRAIQLIGTPDAVRTAVSMIHSKVMDELSNNKR